MALILGFTELVAAVMLITKAVVPAASWADILGGRAAQVYRETAAAAPSAGGTAGASAAAVNAATVGSQVNPVPGATGSRLDQGFDVTGTHFLAPFSGTVVAADISNAGWGGGGYVAIKNALDPTQVVYFAEGLIPTVTLGQSVSAGDQIAIPKLNPYNGILGNIELGPASPSNPGQPLAQTVSNGAAEVDKFYNWLLGLGGPTATSTSLAGHA
jgi:biotin carboxyl carrier protein